MPLGNGDVGINAWVEANGDLVFYVSKTDAWDENARLCKIGRVRVKFDPPLAVKDSFRQELKLRDGVIEIESKIQNEPATIRLWVDADQPVVRVEAESAVPVSCRAEVELWRLRERPLDSEEDYGYGDGKSPQAQSYNLMVLPDVVVASAAPQVVWYHRNTRSLYPVCLEVQHLEALKGRFADPLLNHTFGASLRGADMVADGAKALKSSKPAKRHQLSVCVLAGARGDGRGLAEGPGRGSSRPRCRPRSTSRDEQPRRGGRRSGIEAGCSSPGTPMPHGRTTPPRKATQRRRRPRS